MGWFDGLEVIKDDMTGEFVETGRTWLDAKQEEINIAELVKNAESKYRADQDKQGRNTQMIFWGIILLISILVIVKYLKSKK